MFYRITQNAFFYSVHSILNILPNTTESDATVNPSRFPFCSSSETISDISCMFSSEGGKVVILQLYSLKVFRVLWGIKM